MSVDKFKFISPGIFINEIDNTGKSAIPGGVGPAFIGRSEKGPILKPTRVNSYFEFINVFGNPIPGGGVNDVVRNGNYTSPTYAAYAAQAWFRNNSPITFVRLGGVAHDEATATTDGLAGWQTTDTSPSNDLYVNGGAYGLFVANTPTLSYGSASIACDQSDSNLSNGDRLTVKLNDTVIEGASTAFTLTASVSNLIPYHQFTSKGFSTGSSDTQMAKNITGSLLLAITGNYGNDNDYFTLTVADSALGGTDNTVVITPAAGIPNSLPSVHVKIEPTVGAAYNVGYQLTGTQGSDGTPTAVATANTYTQNIVGSSSANTGTLAAVWYIDQKARIGLSGTFSETGDDGAATSTYVDSVGKEQFKVIISSSLKGTEIDSTFDFTDTSDTYIRNTFNTNPILTNANAVLTTSKAFSRYWLGESYEGAVKEALSGSSSHIGVILPLLNADNSTEGGDFRKDAQDAATGWFFAQDLSTGDTTGSFDVTAQQDLFRLVARNSGDWAARNLKVSIKDIKAGTSDGAVPYGTFSVVIRDIADTDARVRVVEQFNNCNLNPNSENFIARKIGDFYQTWDEADRRYKDFGEYANLSRYVYIDMKPSVKRGDTDARYLPWGVRGPLRFASFTDAETPVQKATFVSGNLDSMGTEPTGFIAGSTDGLVTFEFPKLRLRISGSENNPVDPMNSFYGVDTTFNSSTGRYDASTQDHLKIMPNGINDFTPSDTDNTEYSYNFTLDDMCRKGAVTKKDFAYKVGSRADTGPDYAEREGLTYLRGEGSYKEILDAGVDRFTAVFHGGYDGLDIKESEPLRLVNQVSNDDVKKNYMFNSVQMAIDSLRDPERVEYDLIAMPGIHNTTLNRTLIDLCESRGDSLAIIDLEGDYVSQYETTSDDESRQGSVTNVVNEMNTNIVSNSSYAAAYYPWVQIRDTNSGAAVWVPPSVAAIGAISFAQNSSELWFAPAGFTRGGLSAGRGGLPVVAVRERLTSRDRDELYDNNINPIAQFPAEGIVIFGQKTLQSSASALSRINVRRLLIFLKRQISRYAATILFDQNVRVTWNRFRGQVEPFLRSVQARLGITAFKLVLDETTTTPDLIDRNIMYAKVFIKPARAIEYIAIDFILTDSGAAFED